MTLRTGARGSATGHPVARALARQFGGTWRLTGSGARQLGRGGKSYRLAPRSRTVVTRYNLGLPVRPQQVTMRAVRRGRQAAMVAAGAGVLGLVIAGLGWVVLVAAGLAGGGLAVFTVRRLRGYGGGQMARGGGLAQGNAREAAAGHAPETAREAAWSRAHNTIAHPVAGRRREQGPQDTTTGTDPGE